MAKASDNGISFDLSEDQQKALKEIAGSRQVRLAGSVVGGKFEVNFVACNRSFIACNAPFTACNSAFSACNSPFSSAKKK